MEFYSYLWLREDETPYYVGKGTGNRAWVRDSHHCFPPKDRSRILIFPQDSEADAFESERALIWLFGRKDIGTGILRNMTDGGEGQSGLRHTAAAKEKMATSRVGHPSYVTPAGIAKMRVSRRGKSLGNRNAKGTKRSAEWKAAFSLRMKQVWKNDSARREKTRLQMLGNTHAALKKAVA